MKLIKLIQEKFWIPIVLSLLFGLFLPPINPLFKQFLIPLVMINFFFSSLKVDFLDIISHIKKPFFLIYILLIYLLILPTLMYFLFQSINTELAIAMLLLTAMPPGASVPMLTHIFKGNIALSMAITLVSFLITPFTVVLLFFILARTVLHIDLLGLFQTMLLVTFLPLFVAQTIRKLKKSFVDKTQQYYSFFGVICICFITFIAVSANAKEIFQIPIMDLFIDTLWLYFIFGILFIAGSFITFWRNKSDRIATAVAKTYMNNALALGLAAAFFSPKIVLLMVLSEIPWATTLGIFKWLLKYLR